VRAAVWNAISNPRLILASVNHRARDRGGCHDALILLE
jgi:hypothetical protein